MCFLGELLFGLTLKLFLFPGGEEFVALNCLFNLSLYNPLIYAKSF